MTPPRKPKAPKPKARRAPEPKSPRMKRPPSPKASAALPPPPPVASPVQPVSVVPIVAQVPTGSIPLKSKPEFFSHYVRAWERTIQAWHLLLVQLVYWIVTVTAFIGLAFALLGPMIQQIHQAHPGLSIEKLPPEYWKEILTPENILYLGILFVLAVLWLMILGVLVQGGMMGRLWQYARGGMEFSLGDFFGDMARFFAPILGFQSVVFLVALVLLAGMGAMGFLAAVALKGAGSGVTAFLILALIGLAVLTLPLVILAVGYIQISMGHLTAGRGVGDSFRLGWDSLRADGWRWFWLFLVYFLVTVVGLLVVGGVLGLLTLIPVFGVLVAMFKFLFQMASSVFLAVYLPALTVSFLHEVGSEE